VKDTSSR